MASTQSLKLRIRSVKSTKQITKAMQLVAASKMRRAQESTKVSTPYTLAARELLTHLASDDETRSHPLYVKREVKNRLLIVIAADRGLAGAYNSNVFKKYIQERQDDVKSKVSNQTVAIGSRVTQFVTRLKDTEVIGVYEGIPDRPVGNEMKVILESAISRYSAGDIDAVDVIYTKFYNSINQKVVVDRIIPAGFTPTEEVSSTIRQAEYEPSKSAVLDGVTSRLIGAQLFQALLDARASEYSMRMVAMKNATDNASDLIDDLTLAMNKARQGAITQELAEISGGVEALNN